MIRSTARVTTDRAERYVTQLCKHFAHKVPARWDEHGGHAQFAWGTCTLVATPDAMLLTAEATDAEGLDRIEYVVRDHTERFGDRDGLTVVWHRTGDSALQSAGVDAIDDESLEGDEKDEHRSQ